jgi:hypothetical protein
VKRMGSFVSAVNRLLPFATPGTPLVQDLVHLFALCGLLYFAPQIQRWIQDRFAQEQDVADEAAPAQDGEAEVDVDIPDELDVGDLENEEPVRAEDNVPEMVQNEAPQNEADGPALQEDDGAPGPANAPQTRPQRNVGAKKAKSLARKDQRRAYHEFQRVQGDAQRAREAEGAAEREAALAAERERRRAAEAALEAKKAKELEQKRYWERIDREEEIRKKELTVRVVREELEMRRVCDLWRVAKVVDPDEDGEVDVDMVWVEKILKASGILGTRDGVLTMVTSTGWAVRVSAEDMAAIYEGAMGQVDKDGRVGYEALGVELEKMLKEAPPIQA